MYIYIYIYIHTLYTRVRRPGGPTMRLPFGKYLVIGTLSPILLVRSAGQDACLGYASQASFRVLLEPLWGIWLSKMPLLGGCKYLTC